MARGWESKSVESQQADREAAAKTGPPPTPDDARQRAERRTAELALARAKADLTQATAPAHRAMLEAAIKALERLLPLLLLLVVSACSFRNVSCGGSVVPPPPPPVPTEAPSTASGKVSQSTAFTIAFLGDSLTAGLGLTSQQAYPALLEQMFDAEGYDKIEVINAGVSGDTTAGGLRRVEQTLESNVRILVIALGANDALRGLTTQQTHDNLKGIIEVARAKNVAVLLTGMEAPPNLGNDYRDAFRAIYMTLLREYSGSIAYVPFLLEGVAGNPALNQDDGIHPTAEGQKIIAQLLYPKLRDIVDQLS